MISPFETRDFVYLRKLARSNRFWIIITNIIQIILFIIIMIVVLKQDTTKDTDSTTADIEFVDRDLELRYWMVKAELVEEVQRFINSHAPSSDLSAIVLVDQCMDYGVDIEFVLAQGFIESHFGTKGLARRTNSVWNVGAFDGYSESKVSKSHKFTHPNQSVKPYLELLSTRYLVDKTEEDLLVNFVDSNGHRYASNPNYERELRSKLSDIRETNIDSLSNTLSEVNLQLNKWI